MTTQNLFRQLIYLFILSLPMGANAVIVEGTFHGKVILASDNGDNNNPFFNDLWSEDIIGKSMDGTFWYDTDLMPANSGTNGEIRESEGTDWLNVTFFVDGKTLDISHRPAGFTFTNSWEKVNVDDVMGYTGIRDFTHEAFSLREDVQSGNGQFYQYLAGGISFLDILPALDHHSVIQEFNWVDTGLDFDVVDDIPGLAYFNTDSKLNNKQDQGALVGRISDFSVWVGDPVSVPEPSPFFLFIAGMLVYGVRHLKRPQY